MGCPGAGEHGSRAGVAELTQRERRRTRAGIGTSFDGRLVTATTASTALAALMAMTSTEISVRVFGRDAKTVRD